MKLLFDQNLSFKLCRTLSDLFPGSTQARLVGLADATDRAVWGLLVWSFIKRLEMRGGNSPHSMLAAMIA